MKVTEWSLITFNLAEIHVLATGDMDQEFRRSKVQLGQKTFSGQALKELR